jgi:hydroxymethylpyrimidine/phosphomethylpyrimidine kinase
VLLEALDPEPGCREGVYEFAEGDMGRADPGAETFGVEHARLGAVVPASGAVPAVELRDAFREPKEGVRPDEAWMSADVNEGRTVLEDAGGLPEEPGEVVDVGVGPEGDDCVEASIVEGKVGGVAQDDLEPTVARAPQHVLGGVDSDHLPAHFPERHCVRARTAAEVEQTPGARTEQPERGHAGGIVEVAQELGVVPVRDAVVARHATIVRLDSTYRGAPLGAEITPVEPDPGNAGEGRQMVPRCLTIATSDSGGGAGIQADLKAFAAAGCHGSTVLVALTAQNTAAVTGVHELPPDFVRAQLDAVFDDIGADAVKTGMLFSAELIGTAADYLADVDVPLVVDPVMVASSGAKLLQDDAVDILVARLFPLATVVTPNFDEALVLAGHGSVPGTWTRPELAEAIVERGARAVVVTGGHGDDPVDHLFDGERHVEIPVPRYDVAATHGAGCTHSATLAALLAHGLPLEEAARGAAEAAAEAVRNGLVEIGAGDGPVDVLNVKERHGDRVRRDAARSARA